MVVGRGRRALAGALLLGAACSSGNGLPEGGAPGAGLDSAPGLPVRADVSTCDDLVADPLFRHQADVMLSLATPSETPPDHCTLTVEREAPVLDVLGVDTACSPGWSVVVAVYRDRSGAWQVDPDGDQLGVDGCLMAR